MEVAAFAEHPEEVGGVEIIEGGGDESTPNLHDDNKLKHHVRDELTVGYLNKTTGFMSLMLF